jgi:hypothetical protein
MAIDDEREFDEGMLDASAQWMERVFVRTATGAATGS